MLLPRRHVQLVRGWSDFFAGCFIHTRHSTVGWRELYCGRKVTFINQNKDINFLIWICESVSFFRKSESVFFILKTHNLDTARRTTNGRVAMRQPQTALLRAAILEGV